MQSCQFAKSVWLNADQESSPSHGLAAVSSAELRAVQSQQAELPSKPKHCEMLAMDFSRGRLHWGAAVYSWSTGTQTLQRHVLGLSTPLLYQGGVTDSFPSVHFCASRLRFWTYALPTSGWVVIYFFRFGGSAFCVSPVFVRNRRENFLLSLRRSQLYVFAFALFSLALPTDRGLIVRWTFLNLSKMMYR